MIVTENATRGTDQQSFSFYVDATKPAQILTCGERADAVVVRGAKGPSTVENLRRTGWSVPVLFDRGAYERPFSEVDDLAWTDLQRRAGADRIMSPGRWIEWTGHTGDLAKPFELELAVSDRNGATVLVAIDSRWLTRGLDATMEAFKAADRPIGLVMGHRGDPLSVGGAVSGLVAICKEISSLTVLRCDHGAIGALVFGADHASMGLRTGTRHFVPPDQSGGGKRDDRTARLFVGDLMDWFTAATIAAWQTSEIALDCKQHCCDGAPLARFLDDRLAGQALLHNQVVLSDLATYVLAAPPNDRRRLFARLCRDAVLRYDAFGSMIIEPKAQLSAWAIWS